MKIIVKLVILLSISLFECLRLNQLCGSINQEKRRLSANLKVPQRPPAAAASEFSPPLWCTTPLLGLSELRQLFKAVAMLISRFVLLLQLPHSSSILSFGSCGICMAKPAWVSVPWVELRHWSDLSHRSAGLKNRFWWCEVTKAIFILPVFQWPNLFSTREKSSFLPERCSSDAPKKEPASAELMPPVLLHQNTRSLPSPTFPFLLSGFCFLCWVSCPPTRYQRSN